MEGGGERAAYEMSWLSQLKCDSWLHVGSNNARACKISVQNMESCTFLWLKLESIFLVFRFCHIVICKVIMIWVAKYSTG